MKWSSLEPDEHAIQASCVAWASAQSVYWRELELLYAVPNGGHRHMTVAIKLKAEGVRSGVPDLVLPIARAGFFGLYVEMKTRTGRVSTDQKAYMARLLDEGYRVEVCRSLEGFIEVVGGYLRQQKTTPGVIAVGAATRAVNLKQKQETK
jgi:hypothetical protein